MTPLRQRRNTMTETLATDARPMTEEADFLQIKSIDHLHFWVGNAKHAMVYWWKGFGFQPTAYSGLETGKIRFVVSAPYSPSDEMAAHHLLHGDGVKVIALTVDDVEQAFSATTERGAAAAWAPREERDEYGAWRTAAIRTYGEVLHVFVDRSDYSGPFAPTYRPLDLPSETTGLAAIDHVVGNVQLGKMNHWVRFYHHVMGFRQLIHFDDKDISTEYSALMSKVMQDGTGRVKFPINEPAEGKKKSQIEEYLDYYLSPGVQHIAMASGDILATVRALRERGVEFLRVPDMYYDIAPDRVGVIDQPF